MPWKDGNQVLDEKPQLANGASWSGVHGYSTHLTTNQNSAAADKLEGGWESQNWNDVAVLLFFKHWMFSMTAHLGGGFKELVFSPLVGEMIQFD